MKRINYKAIFGVIFILVQIILFSSNVSAWWDANWVYKQEINLTSASVSPQNYTMNIILDSTNVGAGFNWNDECVGNKTRLRIVDATQTKELPIFVKECSAINQNMSIWIKVEDIITSTGTSIYLYYGNNLGALISEPQNAFDYYINLSSLVMSSESSGSSQDVSGGGSILDSGRTFHTWGNSWKVFNTIPQYTFSNTGTQILEIDMKASDCGEIIATKLDTDAVQEDNYNYRWCGSQTNWGTVPDKQYSGSGNWETVYSVLNDFSITNPTYVHLPCDDDGDASSNVYFRDIRVRKYMSTPPSYDIKSVEVINTTVQSLSPIDNFTTNDVTVSFTCKAATTNTTNLKDISLYADWGSGWHLNETKSLSGQIDSAIFTKTFTENSASYKWNCRVEDDAGFSDWYDVNYTINIDKEKPQITVNYPTSIIDDFTPFIDVSFDKLVDSWYNINGSNNISLCSGCISSSDLGLYLEEGNYILNVFANDSVGNLNFTSVNFEVGMNKKYVENFNDNFSIKDLNGNDVGGGNLSYVGGVNLFNGIEMGVASSNLNLVANQWGGSSNGGEVDVVCPGGDVNCYFEKQDGTIVSTPTIINGITTLDSDSSTVGFIMYSAQDIHTRWSGNHAQNSNHYIAVCYNSGQWYYDNNNGCNNAFTPVATDVLIANLTWGITSVSQIYASSSGVSEVIIKQLNLTHNITAIENVSWTEFGTDASNNVTIDISLDGGSSWYNTTNGYGIENIVENDSLIVKVIFDSDGSKLPGIYNFSILWDNVISQTPFVNITYPLNNSKILGNEINLTWDIIDNQNSLNCSVYIDNVFNWSNNCSSLNVNNLSLNIGRGIHSVFVNVNDNENNTVNSSSVYFTIINNYNATVEKKISFENANMYRVEILGKNIVDFVYNLFTSGSFSTNRNWSETLFIGETMGWNKTVNDVNYSISGVGNYKNKGNYVVGID